MTIGQLVMYHNLGIEIKYPKKEEGNNKSLSSMTIAERKEAIRYAHEAMNQTDVDNRESENDERKEEFRKVYGDIDDG